MDSSQVTRISRLRNSKRYRFAYRFLGPVFLAFCERLRLSINSFPRYDTVVLFVSRSGLRIRLLLEEYLRSSGRTILHPSVDFFASRLAVAKGCYSRARWECAASICKEFKYSDMSELMGCVFRDRSHSFSGLQVAGEVTVDRFLHIVESQPLIEDYLSAQSRLFEKYFRALAKGRRNVVLVDTGWAGSTQAILAKAYGELNIFGLYFGKWDYHQTSPSHFRNMMGLIVEESNIAVRKPQVAILYYHHLIEQPLEPPIPSVEHYVCTDGEVAPGCDCDPALVWPSNEDSHFAAIVDYVRQNSPRCAARVQIQLKRAIRRLARKIILPSREDVQRMVVPDRSADFGKTLYVPVLNMQGSCAWKIFRRNLGHALWKQGQIAVDLPRGVRLIVQVLFMAKRILTGNRHVSP